MFWLKDQLTTVMARPIRLPETYWLLFRLRLAVILKVRAELLCGAIGVDPTDHQGGVSAVEAAIALGAFGHGE